MKKTRRLYIYKTTYEEVKEFAEKNKLKFEAPNRRENFPFALHKYIQHLKYLAD